MDSEERRSRAIEPKVTIGVCVRNCEGSVKEAIDSIIEQDFPHDSIEVIFVDDGSEDDTLSVIQTCIGKTDMRTKVFHTKWQGLGAARNTVVENANGKYIVWVDGDMTLPSDHVRKQVEFMEQNPNVGIAKAKYGMLARENIVSALEKIPFMVYYSKDGTANSKLPGTGGSIYRVETIRQLGGFDGRMKGVGEDLDAAYRIKAAGWSIGTSSAVFYEKARQTWQDLWKQYFWRGYGLYHLYRKNPNIFSLYRMVPIAGFTAGALCTLDAYRLTRRKSVILLPFHFAFKMIAWCFGFTKAKSISLDILR